MSNLILPALFACAFAQALIVANLKFAYDYVRQYSSHCALFARALFGKNLMFFSESVSDWMSDYDDVWEHGTVRVFYQKDKLIISRLTRY